MGGAKALREAPGRATNVAKTRSERSGKRRDGAKRKVSEGSCLRLALVAAAYRSSLRWRWWQWAIAVMLFCVLMAVVQNRLVKVPPTERPTGHIRHQTRRFRRVW